MSSSLKVVQFFLILTIIYVTSIEAQMYPCSCSCCLGASCQVVPFPNVYAYYCSSDSCLQACSTQYPQCRQSSPYGQASAQCLTTTGGPYSCQCNCCNSGSVSCAPTLIGYTTAYSCDTASCSISCNMKYPTVCISNQNGQTQATCLGTTTAVSTTTIPWQGNGCSCLCCLGANCLPLSVIGNTSTSQCSTLACTQACQTNYPTLCPSSPLLGASIGLCTNVTTGATQCSCNCCGLNGCLNYNVYTNGICSSCSTQCLQQTQCLNSNTGSYTCTNPSTAVKQISSLSFNLFLFILFIIFQRIILINPMI